MDYDITPPLVERFHAKYQKSEAGCWEWTAALAGKGYGQIKIPGTRRQAYAHRLSYQIHKGAIPEKTEVCHTCDNPKCVNPAHLFLGSRKENAQDASQKGRIHISPIGHTGVLTISQVTRIKQALRLGLMSQMELARAFGVSQTSISKIARGLRWTRVP
jgi:hypothetical protein